MHDPTERIREREAERRADEKVELAKAMSERAFRHWWASLPVEAKASGADLMPLIRDVFCSAYGMGRLDEITAMNGSLKVTG